MKTPADGCALDRADDVGGLFVAGRLLAITGKLLKTAAIKGESWRDDDDLVATLPDFISEVRKINLAADLFTVAQKLPDTTPRYAYAQTRDDIAAIPINSFEDWWENRVPQETRKNVRRAGRRNVVVRTVEFNDSLVQGIKEIYDETPVRQGRRFWHYGKDLERIKSENSGYLDRSEWIGAYHGEELIGFIKLVYVGSTARIMQIVAKNAHTDKRPMNAILSKAVEVCATKGIKFLIYGQYHYSAATGGQLLEFKRRNGFEQYLVPRYYIPLSVKGRLALKLNLHQSARALLPGWAERSMLNLRTKYYQAISRREKTAALQGTRQAECVTGESAD